MLNRAQASYLCKIEKITKNFVEFFVDSVMDGFCEIIVVSKFGAVFDARTIC